MPRLNSDWLVGPALLRIFYDDAMNLSGLQRKRNVHMHYRIDTESGEINNHGRGEEM